MKLWAGRGENELLASSSPCRPRDHLDGEAGRRLEFSSHFGTVAVYPEFASLSHRQRLLYLHWVSYTYWWCLDNTVRSSAILEN
jgi:hypothetical protein